VIDKLKQLWLSIISYIFPRYELVVSYNNTWGDHDDQTFIVKRFYRKNQKYLKFKTHDGDLVEVRGTEGLNYTIKQL
tara:strand:- start:21 stop:251 length:231 start_codon:yes stop_codon:yes gene_type:complete